MITLFLILLLHFIIQCLCIIPTGELKVKRTNQVLYSATSSFGASLEREEASVYKRIYQIGGDSKDGCYKPYVTTKNSQGSSFYVLISRGNCSFEAKAHAAIGLGAVGVVVYNSLEGIYQGRNYASTSDYECANGMGYVPKIISPIYSSAMDETMPEVCTKSSLCDSGKCVVTNHTDENGYRVCCAWDLYMSMGTSSGSTSQLNIPVVFIRMRDIDTLVSDPELSKGNMEIAMFSRPTYAIDVATVLLWILAIVTITYGSTRAAEEDRIICYRDKPRAKKTGQRHDPNSYQAYTSIASEEGTLIPQHMSSASSDAAECETQSMLPEPDTHIKPASNNTSARPEKNKFPIPEEVHDDTIEITPKHAFGFIAISSMFLILLYFVDLYNMVVFIYLVAAAIASSIVYFGPFFRLVRAKCLVLYSEESDLRRQAYATLTDSALEGLNKYDWATFLGIGCSIWLSLTWYLCKNSSWAWILQDLMGVAVCVVFLSAVRIPNLKVATILLSLAFFYDVFFVYLSPLIFDKSIMLKVVSGNTPTISDENFCEKYPSDDLCQSEVLPMLLVMPTFSSYLSSESMLGLGDIVLPGLLLAWAARYDVRRYGTLQSERAQRGYFTMCLIGYGFGLILANIAVSYFNSGQPALFYIVPLILIPTLYRSFRSETLRGLWEKLPPMNTVALPLGYDEQRALLNRPDVVEVVASWDYKDGVVVLNRIETATAYDTYQLPSHASSQAIRNPQMMDEFGLENDRLLSSSSSR
jgi:hypothetical protein